MSVAVDEKGIAWSWGANTNGELGVGDRDPRIHPFPILTLKGKNVSRIFCGDQFAISLGREVKKEIPNLNLKNSQPVVDISHYQAEKKKKAKKRTKMAEVSKTSMQRV